MLQIRAIPGKVTCTTLIQKKLIFSIQTESFAPANSESMGHEYGRMIVKKMVREKVLDDFTTTSIK